MLMTRFPTRGLVFNLIIFDNSQAFCDSLNFRNDFFLNKIETHGEKCDAEKQVK
jgi:hypothetical protein